MQLYSTSRSTSLHGPWDAKHAFGTYFAAQGIQNDYASDWAQFISESFFKYYLYHGQEILEVSSDSTQPVIRWTLSDTTLESGGAGGGSDDFVRISDQYLTESKYATGDETNEDYPVDYALRAEWANHVPWAGITDAPSSFELPETVMHTSDYDKGIGGANTAYRVDSADYATSAGVANSVLWNNISSKPSITYKDIDVSVVSVVNFDLSTTMYTRTIDGVTLNLGMKFLLIAQTNATQNGVYYVSSGWTATRLSGLDSVEEFLYSAVRVTSGLYYKGKRYFIDLNNLSYPNNTFILGTSAIRYQEMGDMRKSVYDTDADGQVEAADWADATPWSGISDIPKIWEFSRVDLATVQNYDVNTSDALYVITDSSAIEIDKVEVVAGYTILVKDQYNPIYNGIYTAESSTLLYRASDAYSQFFGQGYYVNAGSVNEGTRWYSLKGNETESIFSTSDNTVIFDSISSPIYDKANYHLIPVYCTTNDNITLIGTTDTLDDARYSVGDSVLVKDQTDKTENGIYLVGTSDWTRHPDCKTEQQALKVGAYINKGTNFVNYRFFPIVPVESSLVSPTLLGSISLEYASLVKSEASQAYSTVSLYRKRLATDDPNDGTMYTTNDPITITVGDSIQFEDWSYNNPRSWKWNIKNSSTGTTYSDFSDVRNPYVTFDTEGTYNVLLTTLGGINQFPASHTLTVTSDIVVKATAININSASLTRSGNNYTAGTIYFNKSLSDIESLELSVTGAVAYTTDIPSGSLTGAATSFAWNFTDFTLGVGETARLQVLTTDVNSNTDSYSSSIYYYTAPYIYGAFGDPAANLTPTSISTATLTDVVFNSAIGGITTAGGRYVSDTNSYTQVMSGSLLEDKSISFSNWVGNARFLFYAYPKTAANSDYILYSYYNIENGTPIDMTKTNTWTRITTDTYRDITDSNGNPYKVLLSNVMTEQAPAFVFSSDVNF